MPQLGDEGIRVAQHRTAPRKQLHYVERRRLTEIAHVLLVRDAQDMNARSIDRLPDAVQRIGDAFDHIIGHRAVDMPGELDEAALETALARLPREIKRIDRNAVP